MARAIAVLQQRGNELRGLEPEERDALAFIYHRHAAAVVRTLQYFLGDHADVEDALHDVFIRLPASLQHYAPGNFEGWLRRVASRDGLMKLRKTARRNEESLTAQHADQIPVIESSDFAHL